MVFEKSERVRELEEKVTAFMNEVVYPNENVYEEQLNAGNSRWEIPPIMEEMKAQAKEAGLWNLFLQNSEHGAGLTNLEYAPLKEIMGSSLIGPEVFNCSAPDTGNMELLGTVRFSRTKGEMASSSIKWRNSFCLCDDGTRCSLFRCYQYLYSN